MPIVKLSEKVSHFGANVEKYKQGKTDASFNISRHCWHSFFKFKIVLGWCGGSSILVQSRVSFRRKNRWGKTSLQASLQQLHRRQQARM